MVNGDPWDNTLYTTRNSTDGSYLLRSLGSGTLLKRDQSPYTTYDISHVRVPSSGPGDEI